MSQMHKLKAYFGMVPMDDEYYADGDYADDHDAGRDPREPAGRERAEEHHGGEPAGRRAPAMASAGRGGYEPERPRLEPLTARTGTRRPSSPTRGALAVQPEQAEPRRGANPFAEDGHPLGTITTLHPRTYNEARTIGERYREGNPVIINLTEMSDSDAKRLVDFAAGLAFAMRGAIDKVTNKVFLLSPADVDVSAEDKRKIVENGFYQHG